MRGIIAKHLLKNLKSFHLYLCLTALRYKRKRLRKSGALPKNWGLEDSTTSHPSPNYAAPILCLCRRIAHPRVARAESSLFFDDALDIAVLIQGFDTIDIGEDFFVLLGQFAVEIGIHVGFGG